MFEPRVASILMAMFMRCTEAPPDGGEGGAAGSSAGDAGTAGSHSSGEAGSGPAGGGGAASGEGGTATGEGGTPTGGGGTPTGEGGATSTAGEGGVPSSQGGASAGEGGAESSSGRGGATDSGAGGEPLGGEAGSGERACVIDLLPEEPFTFPIWSESTTCLTIVPSATCPTAFPPIIFDGAAHLSASARPGGTAWAQSIVTHITVPIGTTSVRIENVPQSPWCDVGGNASLSMQLGNVIAYPYSDIPAAAFAGQTIPFGIRFTQTSGAPCSATISNLVIRARVCDE